jgi:hypothetical protein
MQCPECKKLRLECQRTVVEHLELIRMRETDGPGSQGNTPEIWDFILDAAVKARKDTERALADHRATHMSIIARSASMATLALSQCSQWEFPGQLAKVFHGTFAV